MVDVKNSMIRELERRERDVQSRHRDLNFGNALTMSRNEVKYRVLDSKIKQLNRSVKL